MLEGSALLAGSIGMLATGVMLGVLGAWAVRGALRFCARCVVWTVEGVVRLVNGKP